MVRIQRATKITGFNISMCVIDYVTVKCYRYMRTPEAKERLSRFHSKARVTLQHLKRVEKRLELAIERRGVEVDEALHQGLCSTIADSSTWVKEQHPPGSFPRIFWEQQEKAGKLKNAKSMRWEPAMIRFIPPYSHSKHCLCSTQ